MSARDHHPLKVLLVNRALPIHVAGGVERHVEDLALGLAALGLEAHLLAAEAPAQEGERFAAGGVTLHGIPIGDPARYSLTYLRRIGPLIESLQERHRFDLIHAQEFGLGFWKPPPSGPPLVLTVHGTLTSETPLHRDVYPLLGPARRVEAWLRYGRRYLYAPWWRGALGRADRILVDSSFTLGELERLAPACRDRLRLIPLSVREAGPPPPSRDQARIDLGWTGHHLLTIGRLEWQKGQDLAVKALAGLRDRAWHYTIAGTGGRAAALRRLIARLGLEDRITLAGRVDDAAKARMLAGADLVLWPERVHPAFGLAGLEALLHSTPILATRRGAIPEVLGREEPPGGWLVEQATPEAFRHALAGLLAEPDRLAAARIGLRDRTLRRFPFEAMIQSTRDAYLSALGDD